MYITQSPTKPIKTRDEIISDLRWKWLHIDNILRTNNGILNMKDVVDNKDIEDCCHDIENKLDIKIPHDQIEINHNWL